MSANPNKLSQFWQELKRRRVVHVITVYASAAFVIIELINNLTDPLNLPPGLSTIVVVILAVGFPLAIILSWLYDLTGKGVERTKSLSDEKEVEKSVVPNAWKIATYTSFVIIIGLAALNIVSGSKQLRAGDIQSLVILPFDNFTGDEDLEYFVSGMHASLVGDMGKIGGLRVISRTSSITYKNMGMSIPEIASELGVDAVVETAVMCLGDSICIQFKLVGASAEEEQLWIGEYKEEKSQILNLYNRITKQIADEVMVELSPDQERLLAITRTVDTDAYDAFLQSHQYWDDLSEEALNKALEYLTIAVEKDPEWAPPYAGLAKVWVGLAQMGFASPEVAGPKIFENINRAIELDPDLPGLHFTIGVIAVWTEWDWEKGEKEFLQALAINPNEVMTRIYYAHLLMILQRSDEAVVQGQLAVELDPLNPLIKALNAAVLLDAGDWKAALDQLEAALAIDQENFFAHAFMDIVAYHCQEYNKSIEALKFYLSSIPIEEDVINDIERIFNEQGIDSAYEEALSQMELKAEYGYITPFDLYVRYNLVNQHEKTMDWLEKGYELHDPNTPYIGTGFMSSDQLRYNPRYIEILEKMNLPLPGE